VNLHSLRFKLIWIHGAAIALVVVCIGLVRYQLSNYRSQHRFDEELLSSGQLFVSRFRFGQNGFTLSLGGLSAGDALAKQELEHKFILND